MVVSNHLLLFLATAVISVVSYNPDWLAMDKKTKKHGCYRTCEVGITKTCYYTFNVTWYYTMSKACYDCPRTLADCYRPDCISADGFPRILTVVNNAMPGPAVEVCNGDKIIVDVVNAMNDESTSVHWHGHHQVKSPYMDGVPYVTQCPIQPNTVFRYTMYATNNGTHLWHGHTGVQRGDGLFGPLVVRSPPSLETHALEYDHDLSEHMFTVIDWTHKPALDKLMAHLHCGGDNKPDTILINGRGRMYKNDTALTNTPLHVFNVKQGKRYRFRMINAGVANCPIEISIDGHSFDVIASDGYDIKTVSVNSLVTYAGERWDFVLTANRTVGNYWVRFTGLMDCDQRFTSAHQLAVLHYKGAPLTEPTAPVGYNVHRKAGLQMNSLNARNNQPGTIAVPDLHSADPGSDPGRLRKKPDKQIIIGFDFDKKDHTVFHKPNVYGFHQVNSTFQRYTPEFDYVSFKSPSSPPLSQPNDVDQNLYCSNHDLSNCNTTSLCECMNTVAIPTNSTVELILIDRGVTYNANHPFHLHGYAFRVVGMDRLGERCSVDQVLKLDQEGKLERNLKNPPFKDTVTVPDGGYTILRFFATNPGVWLFHCHIDAHADVGMALVFVVGDRKEYPPVPKGFPTCGNFRNDPANGKPIIVTRGVH